jgi:multidrug resistance efflux pump
MKKILILITILIVSSLLTSCWNEDEQVQKKYYSTGSVFSGSIDLSNSYNWYIMWDQMVNLATKVWWRVTGVYFKEWDFVNKWDLLVELDSGEAKSWFSAADNVVNTLLEMKKSTNDMFDQQIQSMEAKVEQVRSWEKWLQNWLEDTITITNAQLQTAKTWVETAKANLDHTILVLDTKKTHIYDNSKEAIVWSIILDTNIINFVDEILWITDDNKDKNDSYEDYLSAKKTSNLTEAKLQFNKTYDLFNEYKDFYDNEIELKDPSKETILIGLNKWETLAEEFKNLLSITYDVIDSSIENVYFPSSTINTLKNTISTFWNNIESSLLTVSWEYILWLKWSRQWLDDFDKAYTMQVDLLEKQLLLAENTYNQYEAMSKWQIREVSTKADVSSSQLTEILAWLEWLKKQKESTINEIQAKINEAVWQRNWAWVMINNWKIISPIDWIIMSKNVEIGQVVWWGMPLLSVSNEDNLEVNILVWEDLAKKINLWDEVYLEIDWLKEQVIWTITNVLSSKDMITKKVWVEISLKNVWNNIQVWSYAKITFKNIWNINSIIIPNSSIISKFMIPWVYLLEDKVVKFKNIEIINGNDSFSEIKWLNVWDTIIINGKENIWDWEILN